MSGPYRSVLDHRWSGCHTLRCPFRRSDALFLNPQQEVNSKDPPCYTWKHREMPKKRRSRGRSKGGKGRSELVQCSNCGMLSPRDKMKRVTSWVSLVEPTLAKELRAKGAYIARQRVMKNLCVSCAVHFGVSKVRSADERRGF